ncbi:MAG: flagellar biosynthesis anti-sigma factor FlgM, partial [Caldimicrobium sp.]
MPINNIKNAEGIYMKINELIAHKPSVTKEKEIQKERISNQEPSKEIGPKGVQDKVEISYAQVIERAVKKSQELSEVREEKVSQIKEAIEKGTYQVSNAE